MTKNKTETKKTVLSISAIAFGFSFYTLISSKGTFLYSLINTMDTLSIFLYLVTIISVLTLSFFSFLTKKVSTDEKLTVEEKTTTINHIRLSSSRLKTLITFDIILILIISEITKNYFVNDLSMLNLKGEILIYIGTVMSIVWFFPYYTLFRKIFITK